MDDHPITVIQDRHSGVYSGGAWLAISQASEFVVGTTTRAQFCLAGDDGPSDGDIEAAAFWNNPPEWIAVGSTPDEAIEALKNGVRPVRPADRPLRTF
jgi:hypothetical protein